MLSIPAALAQAEPSYSIPPIALLARSVAEQFPEDEGNPAERVRTILEGYGVKGEVTSVEVGPVLMRVMFEPRIGTRFNAVRVLEPDIARLLRKTSVRVSMVPGSTAIAIDVPRVGRETVRLGDLVGSRGFQEHNSHLPMVMGVDVTGQPVYVDLAEMPHMLVAGTTGSGKSVGIHAMLISLLYSLTPSELRFMLIDPKMLEFRNYGAIPHMVTPVLTDPNKAVDALGWVVEEMDRRYRVMSASGARDITSFNAQVREAHIAGRRTEEPMYRLVIVVDELADLMLTAGKTVEGLIQRITQKARAAGIHMILATQRPSTDVVTGVIKANIPSRLSFAVTTGTDSRTILGAMGAEHLLGQGDALMLRGKELQRIHGAFVSDLEIRSVTDYWADQVA